MRWIFVVSLILCFSCGDKGGPSDASIDVVANQASISVSWSLVDGEESVTCGEVGATTVSVTLFRVGGGSGAVDAAGCDEGQIVADNISPDTYRAVITIRSTQNRLLHEPIEVDDFELAAGASVQLDPVVFDISRTGNLKLTVDAPDGASNCAASGETNAGIEEVRIELQTNSNQCLDATFSVAPGGDGESGSYASTCDPSNTFGCIDSGQEVTASGLNAGERVLVITGYRTILDTPVACYHKEVQFVLAGGDLETDLGVVVLSKTSAAGCFPDSVDGGIADAGPADAG